MFCSLEGLFLTGNFWNCLLLSCIRPLISFTIFLISLSFGICAGA
uniref:Uncharacterized protein n=1 Tax=Rhizophora mucronata TaxID=61149 RepID=A0A2P2LJV8_RHIMU